MTILLRTLARKSILDFGRYKDRSVQQIIDLKHFRALRWYYYNCSMISFLPDILDEIGIPEDMRISKPGKDPMMGEALDKLKDLATGGHRMLAYENGDTAELIKIARKKAKIQRSRNAQFVRFEREDSRRFSKGNMAWRNQGH